MVGTEAKRVCSPEQTTIVGATVIAADVASGRRTVSLVDRIVHLDGSAHESVLAQVDQCPVAVEAAGGVLRSTR
jgi:hypothetical protein